MPSLILDQQLIGEEVAWYPHYKMRDYKWDRIGYPQIINIHRLSGIFTNLEQMSPSPPPSKVENVGEEGSERI